MVMMAVLSLKKRLKFKASLWWVWYSKRTSTLPLQQIKWKV